MTDHAALYRIFDRTWKDTPLDKQSEVDEERKRVAKAIFRLGLNPDGKPEQTLISWLIEDLLQVAVDVAAVAGKGWDADDGARFVQMAAIRWIRGVRQPPPLREPKVDQEEAEED